MVEETTGIALGRAASFFLLLDMESGLDGGKKGPHTKNSALWVVVSMGSFLGYGKYPVVSALRVPYPNGQTYRSLTEKWNAFLKCLSYWISLTRDVDILVFFASCWLLSAICRIHTRIVAQSFLRNLEDAGVTCFFLLLKRLGGTARKVNFNLDMNVICFYMCSVRYIPT